LLEDREARHYPLQRGVKRGKRSFAAQPDRRERKNSNSSKEEENILRRHERPSSSLGGGRIELATRLGGGKKREII